MTKNMKVDGFPDLTRDGGSGAIINTNTRNYEEYMKSYKSRIQKEERLDKIEEENRRTQRFTQTSTEPYKYLRDKLSV